MSDENKYTASMVLEGHKYSVWNVAVTPDGKRAVSGGDDNTLKVWDLGTGKCTATFRGHTNQVFGVAVTPDGKQAVSGSEDNFLKVWNLETGKCTATFREHESAVHCVAVTPDGKRAVSGSEDYTLKVWDLDTVKCLTTLQGHTDRIGFWAAAITPNGKQAVSGSYDNTLKVWDLETGDCRATLRGHTNTVLGAAITPDGQTIVSGSADGTLKVWDIADPATGRCLATWEGHTNYVTGICILPDGKRVVSGSLDTTLKLWDLQTGRCLATFSGHKKSVYGLVATSDGRRVVSASGDSTLHIWDLPDMETQSGLETISAARYTNAKVVLVGESGAGKTGLAVRLAEDRWELSESTHGMEVRPLKLPQPEAGDPAADADIFRDVWLWDFAGQPDYRLIHQLYMDETALALMVMDPQKDDPFELLVHWEKALAAAVKRPFNKLLVAGRCDRGGMTVSLDKIRQYCKDKGYKDYIYTSAKTAEGCDTLKKHIARNIPWDHLPWTATTQLFKTLKDAIMAVKNEGTVLIRLIHLRHRLKDRLKGTDFHGFTEEELRATVGLLSGQGLIQALDFGDYVLLQPSFINNYASAVVRCARQSTDEMGNISKNAVLEGNLDYKDMETLRLEPADETVLLRAMLQTFLERSLCLEEETNTGPHLVFPSYFKRDRPELPDHPAVLTTYAFTGPVDEIYASLVVRLYYTNDFTKDQLWKNAADFTTLGGKQAGLLLTKKAEGTAELAVYFEPGVQEDTRVSFIKYIHEHLLKRAETVERRRSYVCPKCHHPVGNPEVVQKMVAEGREDMLCIYCEKRFPLMDSIEEKFASPEFLAKARAMDEEATQKLDNESKELILEGQAKAIAGEAGQIYRDVSRSDWGIDAEIEFKNNKNEASGKRVYLQLKSGDSYLYKRKSDGKEIFTIKKPRQAEYWVKQPEETPVMLIIRNSSGEIRWMNITYYLNRKGPGTKQVEFNGEPFTAKNLRRLRKRLLSA